MRKPLYLNRYLKVVRDELPAFFKISRSIPVDFNSDASLDELWQIHDSSMEQFHDMVEKIDTAQLEFSNSEVQPSLLDLKVAISQKMLQECTFCERRCRIDRKKKKIGYCRIEAVSRYSSEFMHYGEEPELVPSHTIFLSGCNFSCVYCQNWQISTSPALGAPIDPVEMARIITLRRKLGSLNVNFVTPTPHTHTILKTLNALRINVPAVWNTNMYYSQEVAKLLDGVIDVYLGDFRYGNDKCAEKYSSVRNYMSVVCRNFESAYKNGEILLRHLLLPGHLECCTGPIVEWVKNHIPHIRFNLMFQYAPHYRAMEYPEIFRYLSADEKERAIRMVKDAGIEDLLI